MYFVIRKNAHNRVRNYEKSHSLLKASYYFTLRALLIGSVTSKLIKQIKDEQNYLKNFLKRVISVIIF